jgi:hypothetical protein
VSESVWRSPPIEDHHEPQPPLPLFGVHAYISPCLDFGFRYPGNGGKTALWICWRAGTEGFTHMTHVVPRFFHVFHLVTRISPPGPFASFQALSLKPMHFQLEGPTTPPSHSCLTLFLNAIFLPSLSIFPTPTLPRTLGPWPCGVGFCQPISWPTHFVSDLSEAWNCCNTRSDCHM